MARYFSEQTLLDLRDKDMNYVYDLTDLAEYLAGVPAADVVPRTEVEKIFFELARKLNQMLPFKASSFINGEPLGNSFDLGREKTIYELLGYLNELRKKYTEGGGVNEL